MRKKNRNKKNKGVGAIFFRGGWKDAGHPSAIPVSGSAGSGGEQGARRGDHFPKQQKFILESRGFSRGIFTQNQGLHHWCRHVRGSPSPHHPRQNTRLRATLAHLGASSLPLAAPRGSPPPHAPLSPTPRCSPQFTPRSPLPSIPRRICRPLAKLVSQQPRARRGACRPPVCSRPLLSPRAAFTKYGRFFWPLVFGTQAAAQERSFPEAEVSRTLPPHHPRPLPSLLTWPCTHWARVTATPDTLAPRVPPQHPLLLAQAAPHVPQLPKATVIGSFGGGK